MLLSAATLEQVRQHRGIGVRHLWKYGTSTCACALAFLGSGCAAPPPEPHSSAAPPLKDIVVYHRAEADRAERLTLEVSRLRDDLQRAEEALVEVESGLRGSLTRANAVSALAEARILTQRAAEQAPWRVDEIGEAQDKLSEADIQVQRNNPGAALFFVYRARRIAELALLEAKVIREKHDAYFVSGARVNLRAGPTTEDRVLTVLTQKTPVFRERQEGDWLLVRVVSGSAGWVHRSLLERNE